MIPERDDFWLSTAPSPQHLAAVSDAAAAAASGANQLLLWRADSDAAAAADNNSPSNADYRTTAASQQTAWSRYLCYVEAMQSQGQKFDQKYVLEAMFRGNDLVYRSNTTAPAATTAATADCVS